MPERPLLSRVAETISRYNMLAPGHSAGVAVSGGADSVALVHVLHGLGFRVTVLHVNHHLRGAESASDEAFVRELAQALRLPVAVEHADARQGDGNLEERARHLRYDFFRRARNELNLDRIAVAHTRSDQAETVLFRFLRGSGTAGLAGIPPVTAESVIRPLIEIDHEEILAWLRSCGISWREDSSNADPIFARNRIRRQLLPQLQRDWNPALPHALARAAVLSREDEQYWEGEIQRHLPALLRPHPLGWVIDLSAFPGKPPALVRRLIRAAIARAKGDLRQVGFEHIESILRLALSKKGSGHVQIPGLQVSRSFGWMLLSSPRIAPLAPEVRITPAETGYTGVGSRLDRDKLSGELVVRCWRSGDAYQPLGFKRPWKLKDLFQLQKVPSWDRLAWPILMDEATIIWSRNFGPASAVAAEAGSVNLVIVWEEGQSA